MPVERYGWPADSQRVIKTLQGQRDRVFAE